MSGETLEISDIREILRLLPHRYPFVMIDRIIDIRGEDHGIGIKNVTFNELQFLGHFPDNPVMPGVLLIEGMAQTAGVLCLRQMSEATRKNAVFYFLTIDKTAHRRNMWWYRAEAKVGDVLIAEAEVGAVIAEA